MKAHEFVLAKYRQDAINRMRRFVSAYNKVRVHCCGEVDLSDDDAVCAAYSAMVDKSSFCQDIFQASYTPTKKDLESMSLDWQTPLSEVCL